MAICLAKQETERDFRSDHNFQGTNRSEASPPILFGSPSSQSTQMAKNHVRSDHIFQADLEAHQFEVDTPFLLEPTLFIEPPPAERGEPQHDRRPDREVLFKFKRRKCMVPGSSTARLGGAWSSQGGLATSWPMGRALEASAGAFIGYLGTPLHTMSVRNTHGTGLGSQGEGFTYPPTLSLDAISQGNHSHSSQHAQTSLWAETPSQEGSAPLLIGPGPGVSEPAVPVPHPHSFSACLLPCACTCIQAYVYVGRGERMLICF